LAQLLARDLAPLDIKVLMIDEEPMADHCCVVALAITADGTKVPVGLWKAPPKTRPSPATCCRARLTRPGRERRAAGGHRRRQGVVGGRDSRVRRQHGHPTLYRPQETD
jgi:hypothetical protein